MKDFNSASIVGLGRFGNTLVRLLKDDLDLILYDKNPNLLSEYADRRGFTLARSVSEVYPKENDGKHAVFYAVPISKFAQVIEEHKRYINKNHTLIDVLSVKEHPKGVFKEKLPSHEDILLTHPMFGPDSSKDGFEGLPIVIDTELSDDETDQFWSEFFNSKGLEVISMSCEEHDQLAARSQGVTHFIGRLLQSYNLEPTSIDTQGAKKLQEVIEMTCNDTWELFRDLQNLNQYTKDMRLDIGEAYDQTYHKLLPDRVTEGKVTIGIQGGVGSFNEQAVNDYLNRHHMKEGVEIKYLYTTENVLSSLHRGDIDMGQFAIHNSVGGIVDESVKAIAQYKFSIIEEFAIKIAHDMMIHPDSNAEEIDTVMTHPQVLKQCKSNLKKRHPNLNLTSGEGEMIDHANVAKAMSEGSLDKNIAVMGPKVLSEIYQLEVIDQGLQDSDENYTSFLMVER